MSISPYPQTPLPCESKAKLHRLPSQLSSSLSLLSHTPSLALLSLLAAVLAVGLAVLVVVSERLCFLVDFMKGVQDGDGESEREKRRFLPFDFLRKNYIE